jgi:small subunit ribosomal protein S1
MTKSDDTESFAALFETSAKARAPKRARRGDRLDVHVVAIGKDAIFVDLGEKQEGFIDRADIPTGEGAPKIEVGTTIAAVVSEADGERIRLTPVLVRSAAKDGEIDAGGEVVQIPRARGGPLLVEGAHVRGTVTGVERYGVFVQIDGTQGRGGRGLVPTAETATPRGADLHKLFAVGAPVEAKILAIQEDGKIRLSFKAVAADAEKREYTEYAKREGGEGATPEGGGKPKGASPRGFGTLGDLLSKPAAKKPR